MAASVELEAVPFELERFRLSGLLYERIELRTGELLDCAALAADEVVVMTPSRYLVANAAIFKDDAADDVRLL